MKETIHQLLCDSHGNYKVTPECLHAAKQQNKCLNIYVSKLIIVYYLLLREQQLLKITNIHK